MATAGKGSNLSLLLCDADDRHAALEDDLQGQAARRQGPAQSIHPTLMWSADKPDDLPSQRWGVIVPEGPAGKRLLEIIDPLIKKRQEQQGAKVRVFPVRPDLSYLEADEWRRRQFEADSGLRIELPRYQLILGNLDQVGMATQLTQASDGFVGRLAFDSEAGYAAYVDKVLRWEDKRVAAQADAKFFTVHDGSGATSDGYEKLMAPGLELAKSAGRSEFPAHDIASLGSLDEPDPQEFLRAAAANLPTVMFSLSHGAGTPRKNGWKSLQDQRQRQGAMSFGSEAGLLTGSDIASRPFLPGGVWFMFACYGAGTPQRSAYRHWLELLRQSGQDVGAVDDVLRGLPKDGEPPFIAALPQAALTNADGPLAFLGHIDLAWSFGYEELDSQQGPFHRPGRYVSVLRSLLQGHRAGPAMHELTVFFGQVNTTLTNLDDERMSGEKRVPTDEEEARRGYLWMARQDLANYMLLGDPAVRLPIEAGIAVPKPAAPVDLMELFGPEMKFAAPPSRPPIEKLENAIAQMLIGAQPPEQIAKAAAIDVSDLRRLTDLYRLAGRSAINGK